MRGVKHEGCCFKHPVGASRALTCSFHPPVAAAEHHKENREQRASCLSPRRVVERPAS